MAFGQAGKYALCFVRIGACAPGPKRAGFLETMSLRLRSVGPSCRVS
jgi:hypothetical protein